MNNKSTIRGYNNNQIYYPVGPEKDSYSLSTWFEHNIETGNTEIKCKAVKNWFCLGTSPRYKLLHTGTPKECLAAIEEAVAPFHKHIELHRIREKAEHFRMFQRDTYKLTQEEEVIFTLGDAYLEKVS